MRQHRRQDGASCRPAADADVPTVRGNMGVWQMRRELEIHQELKRVRKLLAQYRVNDWDDSLLYGAQQALVWMLEQGVSPSELEKTILEVAKDLEEAGNGAT
jgi:NAD-dependent SIR2 family protein deacetylase